MNEDTPPTADEAASGATPTDPENILAVALSKSSNDSFPVLNAFQTFLDQERERARRRVVTMAVCFTGAMIVLLLVFGILFATFFSRMMVRNDRQQDRLLDLVARGIPEAVHEAGYAAPAGDAVSRREILEMLQQMQLSAPREPTAPAPSAPQPLPAGLSPVPAAAPQTAPVPSTVVPDAVVPAGSRIAATVDVPSSTARDDLVVAPPPRTGVLSVADRQAQRAKEAREEAARRARAASAKATGDPASSTSSQQDDLADDFVPPIQADAVARDDLADGDAVPETAPIPAPETSAATTGPIPFALPAGAAPVAAVGPVEIDPVAIAVPSASPAVPSAAPESAPNKKETGRRSITVKPRSRMSVPEGFSTDRTEVETGSGVRIPFRLLVPVPDASR